MNVYEMVEQFSERGDCVCGRCIDAKDGAQPEGHVVDLVFFKVALKQPPITKEAFEQTLRDYRGDLGLGPSCDPFDGKEHTYRQLGVWIGDQPTALNIMGMGALLGSWDLLTPYTVLKLEPGDPKAMDIAGHGYVSIQAKKG